MDRARAGKIAAQVPRIHPRPSPASAPLLHLSAIESIRIYIGPPTDRLQLQSTLKYAIVIRYLEGINQIELVRKLVLHKVSNSQRIKSTGSRII